MLHTCLMLACFLHFPVQIDDPVKIEVFFSKEHVPADLKAGEKVDLKRIDTARISGDGTMRYTMTTLAEGIEVLSVTKEEKPRETWLAMSVQFRVTKEQAELITQTKSTLIPFTSKGPDGKRVTKQRPVPMRIERKKEAK